MFRWYWNVELTPDKHVHVWLCPFGFVIMRRVTFLRSGDGKTGIRKTRGSRIRA